jgi:hypothetical protein
VHFSSDDKHENGVRQQYPIGEEPLSSLRIDYSFPYTLEVGIPATFTVFLSDASQGQSYSVATPIPNGTPNVPISQAFGRGYTVDASAQLDVSPASKFDLPQLLQPAQSLEQQQATFIWTLTPKETTQAVITVTITGQWKPIGKGNEIDIPIWRYRQNYDVTPPPEATSSQGTPLASIMQGVTALGSILTTLGGVGLTLPWMWDQIQKRRNKPKQSKTKKTLRGRRHP